MQINSIISWLKPRARVLLAAVLTAGIVHILATLLAPRMAASTPIAQLSNVAPLHKFQVLAPITPQSQPLPFMAPDFRYAMCRYDTGNGPVSVSVRLPGRGWAVALYTPEGDNFHTTLGQDGQPTDLTLQLTPVADRFLGLTPEARGKASEATGALNIATGKGLIVVRGPDRGIAYRADTEIALKSASCQAHPF